MLVNFIRMIKERRKMFKIKMRTKKVNVYCLRLSSVKTRVQPCKKTMISMKLMRQIFKGIP